jgi:chloramphenicol 3-O phosphotransferase
VGRRAWQSKRGGRDRNPPEILEERERTRKDRTLGQARAQFDAIHRYCAYDLEIDTSLFTPEQCAAQIIARLQDPPAALARVAGRSSML